MHMQPMPAGGPHYQQRPNSTSSVKSRRDEVWEMKRQRFLWRQSGQGASPSGGQRPPRLSDDGFHQAGGDVGNPPGSPLSRLLAGGYPEGQQPSSYTPCSQSSGSRPGAASGTPVGGFTPGRGGGFDANVAGQWSSNVVRDVERRQNRHDPANAGPFLPAGGQRVTQAPGGASAVDLSWGSSPSVPHSQWSSPAAAAHQVPPLPRGMMGLASGGSGGSGSGGAPPRMPSNCGGATPQGSCAGAGERYPSRGLRSGSVAGSARSRAPFGCDDDTPPAGRHRPGGGRQTPTRREAPPFGVDPSSLPAAGGSSNRSLSRGARGASPHQHYQQKHPFAYGGGTDPPERLVAGRTPGGRSQVVFG